MRTSTPRPGGTGRQPRLALVLALAHLRRRRGQNVITVLGVAIGVMVLTCALSLTNGFVKALIEATVRAIPHVNLRSTEETEGGSRRDPVLEARLSGAAGVAAWSPYAEAQGVLSRRADGGRGGSIGFASVVGVDPARESRVLGLEPVELERLRTLPPDGLLLGAELAFRLSARVGDTLYLAAPRRADVSSFSRRAFTLAGTFRTGNYLIDSAFAFARLGPIQAARDTPGRVSGYHVRLTDPQVAEGRARELASLLGPAFYGEAWQALNRGLIQQLALQKLVISIVLLLLVVVAAFGIVNVLVLTVFEKTPEIAILRAMGASGRSIMGAFLLEGLILGGAGLALGNLLGLGLSSYFTVHPYPLPGDLYFITALPVDIRAADFVWVSVASLLTTLLAALVPARRAAGIEPARVIR